MRLPGPNPATHANDYSNENSLVELADGSVYMSIRVNNEAIHFRGRSVSRTAESPGATCSRRTTCRSTRSKAA